MSILQILAEYVLIFYALLGVAVIWLAYEISKALKLQQRVMTVKEAEWSTPSPEQAWKQKPPKPSPIIEAPKIQPTIETDPLKQFFTKEHVTEPITTPISRPRKGQT